MDTSTPTITATKIAPPPDWALLQRQLFDVIARAGDIATEKYARPDGRVYHFFDVDDAYESRSMRGIFYALGGPRRFLDIAKREWDAITWLYSEERQLTDEDPNHPMYMPQLRNEYWNLDIPFNADWFHMGEGNQMLYDFGVADPTNPSNRERAHKFAAMYIGEDPDAPNWDPEYKIFRSPLHGGAGPMTSVRQHKAIVHTDGNESDYVHLVRHWLHPRSLGDFGHRGTMVDNPSTEPLLPHFLYPRVKELEPRWYEDDARREEILDIFDEMVLQGDEPSNLCATALVTNAYLYTGDEKYKRWVLDYVQSWIDRIEANGGIIPDNVGPTGVIGEARDGQWWGGLHGWSSSERAIDRLFLGLIIGAECAHLLSGGDDSYLELLRSQVRVLMENSIETDNESRCMVAPTSYGADGWASYGDFSIRGGPPHLTHLHHASMSDGDYDLVTRVRDRWMNGGGDDWNDIEPTGDRGGARTEYSRFQYYDGKNPDWPVRTMNADYIQVADSIEAMERDTRTVQEIINDNNWPPNPVIVKALIQTTMGSPAPLYNGGILRATVRYFDACEQRPGLPPDVSALVDELSADKVCIQLVNTSSCETRSLIVQAGAFGEHSFTDVSFDETSYSYDGINPGLRTRAEQTTNCASTTVNSKHFSVELPPMTSVRLECGLERFSNNPTYAFPWHGDEVPIE
ncbi:MAG: hypothetical protein OXD46_04800 [Chloroflexi bacterium]|nr:hypothetical protein [Chloroflexota bacterium]